MKKEELVELGLTDELATKIIEMHGKDLSKFEKQIDTLKAEKESIQGQLDTANGTLEKFKDVDVDGIKQEVETYKAQAKQAKEDYEKKLTARDQEDWLKTKFDELGVASPYARKSLASEIRDESDGLKWKDGSFQGFDDFMKSAKEKDNNLYMTEEEKKEAKKQAELKDNSPFFTAGNDDGGSGSGKAPEIPTIF